MYLEHHNPTTEKKLRKKKKSKLDLVSAHISGKETSGSESSVSSKRRPCVLQETGNDSSDDDNIPLAKQAFSSWSDSDSDVSLSVPP